MKSGDFIYDMKKKKNLKKLLYSVDLVLQNFPWRNWERKKCEDMHLCLNLDFSESEVWIGNKQKNKKKKKKNLKKSGGYSLSCN